MHLPSKLHDQRVALRDFVTDQHAILNVDTSFRTECINIPWIIQRVSVNMLQKFQLYSGYTIIR